MIGRKSATQLWHLGAKSVGQILKGHQYPLPVRSGAHVGVIDQVLGDGARAVEIAEREMTRVFSLHTRPPEGGESIGVTADARFHLVCLDLGPARTRIVCVVEPGAEAASAQLVHFELEAAMPSRERAADVARNGMRKAGVEGAEWVWSDALEVPSAHAASL